MRQATIHSGTTGVREMTIKSWLRSSVLGAMGVAVLSLAGGDSADAATATATLSVSASIAGACTVGGAAMAFGAYSAGTAATASSSVQVTCSNGTSAVVTLNQGNNNNRVPTAGTRALANGANY